MSGMMILHIQKNNPEVKAIWDDDGSISFDQNGMSEAQLSSINASINSFDLVTETARRELMNNVEKIDDSRERNLMRMKKQVIGFLFYDQANLEANIVEFQDFLEEIYDMETRYIRSGRAQQIISFVSNTSNQSKYPVLVFDNGTEKIHEFISGELQ